MNNDIKRVRKGAPNHSKNTLEDSLEKQVKKRLKKHAAKAPRVYSESSRDFAEKLRGGGGPFSYRHSLKTQRPKASRESLVKSMSRQKPSGLEARRRARGAVADILLFPFF